MAWLSSNGIVSRYNMALLYNHSDLSTYFVLYMSILKNILTALSDELQAHFSVLSKIERRQLSVNEIIFGSPYIVKVIISFHIWLWHAKISSKIFIIKSKKEKALDCQNRENSAIVPNVHFMICSLIILLFLCWFIKKENALTTLECVMESVRNGILLVQGLTGWVVFYRLQLLVLLVYTDL